MKLNGWNFTQAKNFVQKKRPCINTAKFEDQLHLWWEVKFDPHDDRLKEYKKQTVGRDKDIIPTYK
jgi:hypothetical protein